MAILRRRRVCRLSMHFSIIFCGLAWGLVAAPAKLPAASGPHIDLRASAQVAAETVVLGDIADIRAGEANGEALGRIEVGRAPLPGQALLMYRSMVEMRLRQNGIDPAECLITDNGPVKVLRRHAVLTAGQIREAVQAHIRAHAPWQQDQMKIRPIHYTQEHLLPLGSRSLQVTAPKHTDWLGAIPFKVTIQVDGQTVKRTSVSTYIEVWQEVLLAAKPLGRNQPITTEDVRVEKMNLARVPANAALRMDQVAGRRAARAIAVNSILRTDQVFSPPVVRRGDVVQVLAENMLLTITTRGVAQEDGGIGDHIRVTNIASRKDIHARIVDRQTVQVDF